MPEAAPFTALERGNGFPFCLERVDVEDFEYWITLGGFKKTDGGSPSQAQINLSLANAMKIFWNGYAINGTASTTETSVNSANIEDDGAIFDLGNNVITPSEFDGFNRVCWGRWAASKIDRSDDFFYKSILSIHVQQYTPQSAFIQRMFVDGDFVGYGVAGSLAAAATVYDDALTALVHLQSYVILEEPEHEYAYTTLPPQTPFGIPVIGEAYTLSGTGMDAAALSATDTLGSAQLTSLEFYTYP